MRKNIHLALCVGALALPLAACNDPKDTATVAQSYGPSPTLPPPEHSWIPTVDIASVNRWPDGAKPTAANGMTVSAFAHRARSSAHGLCAAERRRAGRREQRAAEAGRRQGHQGFYLQAGAELGGRRGSERQPHHAVARCRRRRRRRNTQHLPQRAEFAVRHGAGRRGFLCRQYRCDHEIPLFDGDTKISAPGVKLADLPAGTLNHHWTKDLTASPDGTKLYATVGSNSNVGENGMEAEKDRAAVLEVDRASGQWRVFASGLRNPNGPAWNPKTGELWVVVNERDELGNDLVPDYMTSVKDGAFYGWPYSYYGDHVDTRVEPRRPDLVQKAMAPDYALGAHTASLGLAFNTGNLFPPEMEGGAFIGQHGSWNRKPRAGYKVIFVPFKDGKPSGAPQDVLTGFLNETGEAQGRPVGVRLDKQGALLVADDVGNTIWRVTPAAKSASR